MNALDFSDVIKYVLDFTIKFKQYLINTMPLPHCFLICYPIFFLNHEELIQIFNDKMLKISWYSIVNKTTGTEILINFKCNLCKHGSTCMENHDEILLFFSIKDCVPIKIETLSDGQNMDNIFRCDHRVDLKNNKLTQSLKLPILLSKLDKINEQKIRHSIKSLHVNLSLSKLNAKRE